MVYRRYAGFNRNAIWVIIGVNFFLFIIINVIIKNIDQNTYIMALSTLGLSPSTFLGYPWTIVTNMFVHGSFWHIFANMLTLFFFGSYFASLVGNGRFLLVYFGGGVLGSILYLILGPTYSIAVGASGAVYAVAGTLVMMRPNLRVLLYFIVPMPLWVVILVFFVIWSLPNIIPNVAWQAHLGGLIFGLIAGYIFRRRERYFFR